MRSVRLGEVIERVRRPIVVRPEAMYREIGIRSYGRGIFHKHPRAGAEIGNKRLFAIEPGDLVFNIVFAWEGAVAVAGATEAGMCGSHRFPTYRPVEGECDVRFLKELLLTREGLLLLASASPGSAGRNRTLNQSALLDARLSLPSLTQQRRCVDLIAHVDAYGDRCSELASAAWAAVGALLDQHEAALKNVNQPISSFLETTIGGVWGEEPGSSEVDVAVFRSTDFDNDGTLAGPGTRRSITARQLSSRSLRRGDVLLEKSGGGPKQPVGRVVWVDEDRPDAVCANFIQLVRPSSDRVDPRYLFLRLWNLHRTGRTLPLQTQTTGIRNLRTKEYLSQPFAIPEPHYQTELASTMDALIEAARSAEQVRAVVEGLRAAIVARTLSGDAISEGYDEPVEVRS